MEVPHITFSVTVKIPNWEEKKNVRVRAGEELVLQNSDFGTW